VVSLGMLIYAASLALTGWASSAAFFYVAMVLGPVGFAGCSTVAVMAALGKKVGEYALTRVAACIVAAAALASLPFGAFAFTLIDRIGSQATFILVAILVALAVPLASGLRTHAEADPPAASERSSPHWMFGEAFTRRRFLLLLFGFLAGVCQISLIN